ncbi:MAG: hypothetical protein ACXVNO_04990 [Bacteroidia bacterium]
MITITVMALYMVNNKKMAVILFCLGRTFMSRFRTMLNKRVETFLDIIEHNSYAQQYYYCK